MDEGSSNTDNLKPTRYALYTLAGTGLISVGVAGAFYLYFFMNHDIVEDPAAWGQLGDYFGGMLNPVIGLLGVLGLLWTIYQNQRELSESSKQLRLSAQALDEQRTISAAQEERLTRAEKRQDLLNAITIIVDSIESDWFRVSFRKTNGQMESLYESTSILRPENQSAALRVGLKKLIAEKTGTQLNVLAELMVEYDTKGGNEGIFLSMMTRVMGVADIVKNARFLSSEAIEFYYGDEGEP